MPSTPWPWPWPPPLAIEAAFARLVEELALEVRAFVAARASSAAMTEELVQQAFVTAWERLASYEPRGTLLSWIKGIAHNHLREELRRLRRTRPDDDLAEILVAEDCLAELDAADERERQARRLHACLERLPPRTRTLVERRYWHDEPLAGLDLGSPGDPGSMRSGTYHDDKETVPCLRLIGAAGAPLFTWRPGLVLRSAVRLADGQRQLTLQCSNQRQKKNHAVSTSVSGDGWNSVAFPLDGLAPYDHGERNQDGDPIGNLLVLPNGSAPCEVRELVVVAAP